jgi:monoamine oxidase
MDLTRRRLGLATVAAALSASAVSAQTLRRNAKGPSGPVDVLVLGAGVSGLNAAWLLEREGLKVCVLEGRSRVGGRVHTLLDQPGVPEMGFNSMAAGYGRGIDAAKRAGVELYDVSARFMKSYHQELVMDGRILTRPEWAQSPANPFPEAQKMLMPWEISGKLLHDHNPLKDWSQWTDPKNAALDISLHDFLKAQGLNDPAIHLAVDTSPYYGTSSYDLSALMSEFADGWTKTQVVAGPKSYAVRGGNERLPIAMAKLLKGDVLLNREVIAIMSDSAGVTVACATGETFRAKRVVCALPFSTLRRVKIAPGLTGAQAQAVQTLPYQSIANIFLKVRSPFWEIDKLSPSMWTNGIAGVVIAQRFGKTDDEVTGLLVEARGELANAWDRLGPDQATQRVIGAIEAIRPAAKGQLVGAAYFSWGREPFNAGDWAYFAPGQITAFANQMAAPAGRLHFCGEHTALANRGLEGAMESSERVAVEVLSA